MYARKFNKYDHWDITISAELYSPSIAIVSANPYASFTADDAKKTAHLFAAAGAMKEALEKVDKAWTSEFPEGPDGSRKYGAFGELSEDTVAIWRDIRAALTLAEPR